MLDREEEEKPRKERKGLLHHQPAPEPEERALQRAVPGEAPEERILPVVHAKEYVAEQEHEADRLRNRRGNGRARNAHRGHGTCAEDEHVVEDEVRGDHDERARRQDAGPERRDEECTQKRAGKRKGQAPDAPVEIRVGRLSHRRRLAGRIEKRLGRKVGEHDEDRREPREKEHPGAERPPDLRPGLLAVLPAHVRLHAEAVPHAEHHEHEEEDARERRGAELHFADTPEKGDVGHADELLEQEAQHQRNGHAEDGAARIDAAAFDFEGHVQKD